MILQTLSSKSLIIKEIHMDEYVDEVTNELMDFIREKARLSPDIDDEIYTVVHRTISELV